MNMSKIVRRDCMDTKEKLPVFMSKYPDAIKIDVADVYWSEKYGVLGLVVSQQCKDFFFGVTDVPPNVQ